MTVTATSNEVRLINEGLSYHVTWRECDANTNMIGEYLRANNLPINFETVPQAIVAVQSKLIKSQRWADACDELRQARSTYQFNEGVFGLVAEHIDDDRELSSMAVSVDTLVIAFDEIKDKHSFKPSRAFLDQQNEIAERARMLHEISGGNPTYSCRSNNDNRITHYNTADLAEEPTAVIRDVYNIVVEQRRVENMSVAEIQAERKKREFERVKALNAPKRLPDQWVITKPIPATHTEEGWEAGCAVPTIAENIRRMHRDDLMALIRNGGAQGADLVNERLGYKKPQQFGNVQSFGIKF
jgi:hypothetical protein